MGIEELPLWQQNEEVIREYFEGRGWSAEKLDPPERNPSDERVADWRVCRDNVCFLCEVKTIYSVRADIPYAPASKYFRDEREARRAKKEKSIRENPDGRLGAHRDEYEFLYSEEEDFRKRHRHRRRNTEYEFEKYFAKRVRCYFAQSSIHHLPYLVTLCSDDCYTPKPGECDDFCKRLEDEIRLIYEKEAPSWPSWVIDRQGLGLPARYTVSYPIHKATYEGDGNYSVDVMVLGPGEQDHLEVHIYCYGGLNLDAITRNVKGAESQLRDTASREQNPNIARVVVLAFATGIDPSDWEELSPHIACLLEEYCDLSAIAVLVQAIDGTPRFIVYHNSWLRDDVELLNTEAFNHEWSNQRSPINWKQQI